MLEYHTHQINIEHLFSTDPLDKMEQKIIQCLGLSKICPTGSFLLKLDHFHLHHLLSSHLIWWLLLVCSPGVGSVEFTPGSFISIGDAHMVDQFDNLLLLYICLSPVTTFFFSVTCMF